MNSAMFLTAHSWSSLETTATIKEKFGEAKNGPVSGVASRCKKKTPEISFLSSAGNFGWQLS